MRKPLIFHNFRYRHVFEKVKPNKRISNTWSALVMRDFGYDVYAYDGESATRSLILKERPMGGRFVGFGLVDGYDLQLSMDNWHITIFMDLEARKTLPEEKFKYRYSNLYDQVKLKKSITPAFIKNIIRWITL